MDLFFINQNAYVQRILRIFNMNDAIKVGTPVDISRVPTEEEILVNIPYREVVGSLMHLSCVTRPDIAYAVSKVSQKLSAPTKSD